MQYDLAITNALVVTADEQNTVVPGGAVCAVDGEIRFVGMPDGPVEAKTLLDAGGGIVMPGLVNTHTHAAMTLFRGLADDLALDAWLNDHVFPAESRYLSPDSVRAGTLLACAEMLLSGTTCLCDGYFYEDQVAGAVAESGMRGVLAHGIIDFPAPGVPDPSRNVDHAVEYAAIWKDAHPRITPSLFGHSPYTCSAETLVQAKQAAGDLGVLFQIHVSETRGEVQKRLKETGKTPVAYLDELGVLDPHTLAVHCVWATPEDMDIFARADTAVSVPTGSNMKLASGAAPLEGFLARGIRTGLGTDGAASNNNLDMFSEMDHTAKLRKLITGDPTACDAPTILSLATRRAAQSIGLGQATGSLELGKRADLVVLDSDSVHLNPLFDPVSAIVYAADGSDVKHVVVDGKIVVRDRTLLTMDLDRVMHQVKDMARSISG